jgi:tRNA(Ile)-lysidine synthetase-like protein
MKTLALVSGGPDSVFLFHWLRKRGEVFEVLHCNHHLRGAESDAEQGFVERLCSTHGVVCHVRHLSLAKTGNTQAQARAERLKACFALQESRGITRIVTAHHRDDWLETLLMRQRRGAGLAGLAGIRYRWLLPHPQRDNVFLEVHRPLLHRRKEELLAFLTTRGWKYCIDSSNATPRYERNRVRAHLHGHKVPEEVFKLAAQLQGIDAYFTARANSLQREFPHAAPSEAWQPWPKELRFRYFRDRMRAHGYQKQIERRHFAVTAGPGRVKLVLDQAVFVKNRHGWHFSHASGVGMRSFIGR